MSDRPSHDHALVAYAALAHRYDLFTAHHDYDGWMRTFERLAVEHGLAGRRHLDVACGTGKSFLPFLQWGYAVTACDVSPAMAALAAEKAAGRAEVVVRDMRDLGDLGCFDLVSCVDDAVNYLLDADELVAALSGMRRNLAPGGVIVFDVNTLIAYREFYGTLSVFQGDEGVVVWDGTTPADLDESGLATATAEVLVPSGSGPWSRETAVHHQRHHPRRVVERALRSAGLEPAGIYGMQLDGSVEPGYAEHGNSKAIYVARHA